MQIVSIGYSLHEMYNPISILCSLNILPSMLSVKYMYLWATVFLQKLNIYFFEK